MANNEEELKKEVARLQRQYEAEIPRLTDLSVAMIDAFKSNDASPPELLAVCLDLMLQAIGHIFGETKAEIISLAFHGFLRPYIASTRELAHALAGKVCTMRIVIWRSTL